MLTEIRISKKKKRVHASFTKMQVIIVIVKINILYLNVPIVLSIILRVKFYLFENANITKYNMCTKITMNVLISVNG